MAQEASFQYGIVISGDRELPQAQFEVNRAKKNKPPYPNTYLFYRSRWYRGLVLFKTKKEADSALPTISKQIRKGSYIVKLNEWCPGWQSFPVRKNNTVSFYRCT
ncbi:hypothetical protein ACN4EK_24320 [Pantanalinema rosaneae CENA516]